MTMQKATILSLLLLLPLALHAQKEFVVEAQETYVYPDNVSRATARRTVLQRAQNKAIEEKFGTHISSQTSSYLKTENGVSTSNFTSKGTTETNGEWIETIVEPRYTFGEDERGSFVTCYVKGRIREIANNKIMLDARVLRNSPDERNETSEFKHRDNMFLYFSAPVDGYIMVFLADEQTEQVYCLLPYKKQEQYAYQIFHDKPYYFFSNDHYYDAQEQGEVQQVRLTCDDELEMHELYVVFSPNVIRKPVIKHGKTIKDPNTLAFADFEKWLSQQRRRDKDMNVEKRLITITK